MTAPKKNHLNLTYQILIAMFSGFGIGLLLFYAPKQTWIDTYIVNGFLAMGGQIFISLMKMLVVPVVLISLVCGIANLADPQKLGRVGLKTVCLYIFTTAVAIALSITVAELLDVGTRSEALPLMQFHPEEAPSLRQIFLNFFPTNPIDALARGDMLQIIVFALLLGSAIALLDVKETAQRMTTFFEDLNHVIMRLISMILAATPYGVFCLVGNLFAQEGFGLISQLLSYFCTVILVLLLHLVLTNSILLKLLANLNPIRFFNKMYSAMLFAFSTSSSNVSIPVVLTTVEKKLGVHNSVASFIIPLGATINMDGTAIMQGVATVFISHAYQIDIGLSGYLMVILTATLASIGTAGVPGVGLITLAMVLKQVGLPVEGIGLIIGVDRLLDMLRTAVNVTGDSAVACVVAKSEGELESDIFNCNT